jgi:hypothetical protein
VHLKSLIHIYASAMIILLLTSTNSFAHITNYGKWKCQGTIGGQIFLAHVDESRVVDLDDPNPTQQNGLLAHFKDPNSQKDMNLRMAGLSGQFLISN